MCSSADRFPELRSLPDGRHMQLCASISYRGRLLWQAKKGLITDGASIPMWIAWLVGGPFEGRHRRAALFHDAYYARLATETGLRAAVCSKQRFVVDRMLLEVSVADGTAPWRAVLIYIGVRLGGGLAWRGHAKRKQAASIAAQLRSGESPS